MEKLTTDQILLSPSNLLCVFIHLSVGLGSPSMGACNRKDPMVTSSPRSLYMCNHRCNRPCSRCTSPCRASPLRRHRLLSCSSLNELSSTCCNRSSSSSIFHTTRHPLFKYSNNNHNNNSINGLPVLPVERATFAEGKRGEMGTRTGKIPVRVLGIATSHALKVSCEGTTAPFR